MYGVLHSSIVPAIAHSDPNQNTVIFGTPLILRLLDGLFHPGVNPCPLASSNGPRRLGRPLRHLAKSPARWTTRWRPHPPLHQPAPSSHYQHPRSVSPSPTRSCLVYSISGQDFCWLCVSSRTSPIYEPVPLDPPRRFAAFLSLVVFILCFMPAPSSASSPHS